MRRTLTGTPPNIAMPRGSVDTQMHMYMPGYPSAPGSIALPSAPPGLDDYRQVMRWLGLERVIITQGNAHGRDNANLLACLAAMGEIARGVAIIDAQTSDAELERLSSLGIVGARVMDLPGGAVTLRELPSVDDKASAHDWYVAVQFDGSDIVEHMPLLTSLRSRWVLDHHGKFLRGTSPDGREIDAVKRFLDTGKCYYKLAGVYESSRTGPPDYLDVAAVTEVISRYAPDRIVWGTNWPHNRVTDEDGYPNDADLLDLVLGWLPDERSQKLVLVDNPAALAHWPLS